MKKVNSTKLSKEHVLLVCHAGKLMGLGHIKRMLVLADALTTEGIYRVSFLVFGEPVLGVGLSNFQHIYVNDDINVALQTRKCVEDWSISAVVYDLYPEAKFGDFEAISAWLASHGVLQVGVDCLLRYCNCLDLVWIPSFYVPSEIISHCAGNVSFGWSNYLLKKRLPSNNWTQGPRVIVVTGGGDPTGLATEMPAVIDEKLALGTEIHWVRGPYSGELRMPAKARLRWVVHNAPERLDELMVSSNYALAVFGISFFELLQYGVPTVVFSPYGKRDEVIMNALRSERVSSVACDADDAVDSLDRLMKNDELAIIYSKQAQQKLSVSGALGLATEIKMRLRLE